MQEPIGAATEEVEFPLTLSQVRALAARSAGLGSILTSDRVSRIVEAYRREDRRAIDDQTRFFRVARDLNLAVLTTAVVAAIILVLGVLRPWLDTAGSAKLVAALPVALQVLGLAGLLVGGFSAARLYELNAGDLAGRWMRSRALAEQRRGEYFTRVVAAAIPDAEARAPALDLVVNHLLKHQLRYFAERGARHEAKAGQWLRWAAFASGAAAVGVGAGGMAGASDKPWILAIAALGAVGGAVASFAAAQDSIGQERERAQRYRNNVDALELLMAQVDDVRDAIAAGASDPLVTFTSALDQQLALELGRFLTGGDSIRAAVATLGQQVEEGLKKGKSPP